MKKRDSKRKIKKDLVREKKKERHSKREKEREREELIMLKPSAGDVESDFQLFNHLTVSIPL